MHHKYMTSEWHLPYTYGLAIALVLSTGSVLWAEQKKGKPDEVVPAYGPVVDRDPAFLKPPEVIADSKEFTVAKTPPRITFSTCTGLPGLTDQDNNFGLWTSWGEGVCASTGKFYAAIGDHRGRDAQCFLYEYDPATHRHRKVLDVGKLIGQKPGDWGHGKVHGRLDEMPDGWIWLATYWGTYPDKLPPDQVARLGGRLVGYNCKTGRSREMKIPLAGDSWPMFATDTRRGIFHAVGLWGQYLAYDLYAERPLYYGRLPGDITFFVRSTLLDPRTGICYASEDKGGRIAAYDPNRNRLFHTKAVMPTSKQPDPSLRSYTRRRLQDGSFLCQTYGGIIFKFFPDEQRIEEIGPNWAEGLYCTSMALSPDDKHIYYTIGAHGNAWRSGCPIVQMDTTTYAKKVLAFLHPYYQEKHGYVFGGSYATTLDAKGENLLIVWNGRFRSAEETDESFGHPSFMWLEIPVSERQPT